MKEARFDLTFLRKTNKQKSLMIETISLTGDRNRNKKCTAKENKDTFRVDRNVSNLQHDHDCMVCVKVHADM